MNIWVPKRKILEPKSEIILPFQMAGFFKLEAFKLDGRRRLVADWFPNLILDQGLERPATNSDWLNACRVGTGSTAPANSQTNLISHLAGTTNAVQTTQNATASAPYYGYTRKVFRFAQGAAAGNLTELGIGWSDVDGSNLFSRALILDNLGSPTTKVIQADEFLDVSYELRCYAPSADITGTLTIGSDTYDFTSRAAEANSTVWCPPFTGGYNAGFGGGSVTAYSGAIGAETGSPAGTPSASASVSNGAYSAGSHQVDYSAVFGLDNGNVGGIMSVYTRNGVGSMQHEYDPVIDKDNTKILSLPFRHTWARKTI